MNEQRYFGKLYLHKPPVNLKRAQLNRNHIRLNVLCVYVTSFITPYSSRKWMGNHSIWLDFFVNFQINFSVLLFTVILQLESNTTIYLFFKTFRLHIIVLPWFSHYGQSTGKLLTRTYKLKINNDKKESFLVILVMGKKVV